MISEIMALMKLAHEGGAQTLLIVVLSMAWLRERQQVHALGQKAFELMSVVMGPDKAHAAARQCTGRDGQAPRVGPADARAMMGYAIRRLREKPRQD